jgi:hypothetical protein
MRFAATLNDQSFINIPATHMEVIDGLLWVWDNKDLVALVETTAIISAKLCEGGFNNGNK